MLLFLSQEAEVRPRPGAAAAGLGPAPGMAVCGEAVGAGSLPSELVVHIFSFLAGPDRLRASAACSHWRECLFYPALWPRLRLSLRVSPAERPRLDFLMRKCGWFVRELRVQFAADNYPGGGGGVCEGAAAAAEGETPLCPRWLDLLRTYLELVLCVLSSVRNNRNLQKLSLFGDISILQQHGSISNTYLGKVDPDGKKIKQIQQLFEEILGNSRQLKWLSCGFMLQIVTPTSLSSLSNPIANTMEHLSLLDNHIPGNTTLITAVELERFVNLRSLALDFCDFTAEMARVLADSNHVPLHRLSLLVHKISIMHKSLENMPEDENWKALTRNSTNLRVYIMAFDIKSDDMLRILKPSIPLERIHFDSYITCVSGAIVDLISRQYDKFLTHFILMNDVIDMSGFPDLSDNRNEDPLVLLAWRCTRLSLLAVHGYTVWAHNLIAIARLRGSDLKVLEVTEESIDFDQGELADQDVDPVHNLIEQVSLGLGRPWRAVMDIELLSVFTEPTRHFYREMQSFSEGI
ncbi:sodium- and chloride-dependent taurine transporter [Platysternon megacephalum]|uniref:Sodium-and chloride-dependent taurine transporter n=1 Tax=Platysternon megacephalum TaxID=55544 RepID=A0A4D9EQB9_9SAUR|nr:sodium- and chloride-dependent taurine transporter [Platysternon megacephalum]